MIPNYLLIPGNSFKNNRQSVFIIQYCNLAILAMQVAAWRGCFRELFFA
jgi:hypothetical protein